VAPSLAAIAGRYLASDHQTVDLPDDQRFEPWARQQFPGDRHRVLLEHETAPWPSPVPDPAGPHRLRLTVVAERLLGRGVLGAFELLEREQDGM
jgi:hypothetical protein